MEIAPLIYQDIEKTNRKNYSFRIPLSTNIEVYSNPVVSTSRIILSTSQQVKLLNIESNKNIKAKFYLDNTQFIMGRFYHSSFSVDWIITPDDWLIQKTLIVPGLQDASNLELSFEQFNDIVFNSNVFFNNPNYSFIVKVILYSAQISKRFSSVPMNNYFYTMSFQVVLNIMEV